MALGRKRRGTAIKRIYNYGYDVAGAVCVWMLVLLLPLPSMAQRDAPQVLLIVFDPAEAGNTGIAESVQIRLDGIPIRLVTREVAPKAMEEKTRRAIATDLLGKTESRLAFYWELEGERQIRFLVETRENPYVFSRKLEGAGELSMADVVALISRTTIELLLESGELDPLQLPAPPSPEPEPDSAPSPQTKPYGPPRMYVDLGYTLTMGAATPAFAHGGRLAVGYRFLRFMRVMGGVGAESPLKSSEAGVTVRSQQFPLMMGIGVVSLHNKIRWGVQLAALVVPVHKKASSELSEVNLKAPYWRVDFQLEMMTRLEVAFTNNMGFYVGAGARLVLRRLSYEVSNGPILFDEFWRICPTVTMGVQLMAL